ncbi:hypothetical protein ACFQPF_11985 [Fictibacillus iocasae]|uniref:Uncharacterized protein n=1 Tax=Fictibacillus iocasae TaxID=2715437 RepID=A0ABW2NPK3_9BACL
MKPIAKKINNMLSDDVVAVILSRTEIAQKYAMNDFIHMVGIC